MTLATTDAGTLVHATAVACAGRAALIIGPSGAGKSDLALRLVTTAWRDGGTCLEPQLVADDQVLVVRRGAALMASPPATLAGLIEVRGLGIVAVQHQPEAEVALVVNLVTDGGAVERMPDPREQHTVLGVSLPVLRVRAFEASAPAKVALALARLGAASPARPGEAGLQQQRAP